jgi:hypothetical protein
MVLATTGSFLVVNTLRLITSAAFVVVFDGEKRDPKAILLAANRLMDYYERFLGLGERIRRITSSPVIVKLQQFMWDLAIRQLINFDEFIEQFIVLLERGEEGLRYESGEVNLGRLDLVAGLTETTRNTLQDLKEVAWRHI